MAENPLVRLGIAGLGIIARQVLSSIEAADGAASTVVRYLGGDLVHGVRATAGIC